MYCTNPIPLASGNHTGGICALVHHSLSGYIVEYSADHIYLSIKFPTLVLIACYIPPSSSIVYQQYPNLLPFTLLQEYIQTQSSPVIVLGDFNARVGSLQEPYDHLPPRIHHDPTINAFGRRLRALLSDCSMVLANGRLNPL